MVADERVRMSAAAIELNDVALRVGDFALRRTFRTGRGLTAMVGPSGSGKSLTLALIAGLRRPKMGTIHLDGTLVAADRVHVRTQDRGVGMVFQDGLLLPHRSCLDNVMMAGALPSAAIELLSLVGAKHLSRAEPVRLSGGERQRVALARALAGSPRLLLLDEPFSALDASTRVVMRRLLREVLDERGVPALLVTHDKDDAGLADEVIEVW